jgi:hypothetical protein
MGSACSAGLSAEIDPPAAAPLVICADRDDGDITGVGADCGAISSNFALWMDEIDPVAAFDHRRPRLISKARTRG